MRPSAIAFLLSCAALWGCDGTKDSTQLPPGYLEKGPEDPTLADTVKGVIVFPVANSTGVVITHLPGPSSRTVLDGTVTFAVSLFTNSERFAYVELLEGERAALKSARLDGTQIQTCFEKNVNTPVNASISKNMALHPSGEIVAILTNFRVRQTATALLQLGTIEVWDLGTKKQRSTLHSVLDDTLAWFPDGRQLTCVQLLDTKHAPALPESIAGDTPLFDGWKFSPVITIWDVEANESHSVCTGEQPTVSSDGRFLVYRIWYLHAGFVWYQMDLRSGRSHRIDFAGAKYASPIGLIADDLLIFAGVPTEGSLVRYTERNSPMRGHRDLMAVKVAKLGTTRFCTLVSYLDPRDRATVAYLSNGGTPK